MLVLARKFNDEFDSRLAILLGFKIKSSFEFRWSPTVERRGVSFGISLGVSPRESFWHTVDVVKSAETYGFERVYITDVPLSMKDCYVALALCAVNTSKILLGTGVTNPLTREAATTASAISAIHELSRGRAILGLGSGYSAVLPVGLPMATVDQVEEVMTYIRTICEGKAYIKNGLTVRLATAQGAMPIYLAASQPRMLRLAGRLADGVILMGGADPEFAKWQLEHIRAGATKAGRAFEDIVIDLWFALSMAPDSEKALDEVRPWAVSQADTFSKYKVLPEFLAPFREDIVRAGQGYERLDHLSRHARHKGLISDELVRKLAIVGDVEECVRRLAELTALGIRRMTLALVPGGRQERLRIIATQLMPQLQTV